VRDGLGGPPVAGLRLGEVASGLTVADPEVGTEGLGQRSAGPGPVPAEPFGAFAGDERPSGVVGFGTRGVGGERRSAGSGEALEGGSGRVGVAAEVRGEARGRPAQVGQQDHLQAVARHRREVRSAQGLEFGTVRVRQVDT
jgi:hypothetical protein